MDHPDEAAGVEQLFGVFDEEKYELDAWDEFCKNYGDTGLNENSSEGNAAWAAWIAACEAKQKENA